MHYHFAVAIDGVGAGDDSVPPSVVPVFAIDGIGLGVLADIDAVAVVLSCQMEFVRVLAAVFTTEVFFFEVAYALARRARSIIQRGRIFLFADFQIDGFMSLLGL